MDALRPLARGIQIGADIGQRVDPTAIIVAERELRGWSINPRAKDSIYESPIGGDIHYVIRFIQRLPLNTSYPAVVERLAEIYNGLGRARVSSVLIDATGVGTPVVDLVRDKEITCTAVYLTGGEKATRGGSELRLAKSLMISRLQVLLQQRFIHLPKTAEAEALTEELLNYEIKVTDSQNLQMGVFKTGKHDDLATALGLACWDVPSFEVGVTSVNWYDSRVTAADQR